MGKLNYLFISVLACCLLYAISSGFKSSLETSDLAISLALASTWSQATVWVFLIIRCAALWGAVLIAVVYLSFKGTAAGFPLVAAACVSYIVADILGVAFDESAPLSLIPTFLISDLPGLNCSALYGFPSPRCLLVGTLCGLCAIRLEKAKNKGLMWGVLGAAFVAGIGEMYLASQSYLQLLWSWTFAAVLVFSVRVMKLEKKEALPKTLIYSHCFAVVCLVFFILKIVLLPSDSFDFGLSSCSIEDKDGLSLIILKTPLAFILPGFTLGLRQWREEHAEWPAASDKNAAVRVVFSFLLLGSFFLLRWVFSLFIGPLLAAVLLSGWCYFLGFISAFITPKVAFFAEDKTALEENLVKPIEA